MCGRIHDFINGTTVALPNRCSTPADDDMRWDILRPGKQALALVADHLAAMEKLSPVSAADGP